MSTFNIGSVLSFVKWPFNGTFSFPGSVDDPTEPHAVRFDVMTLRGVAIGVDVNGVREAEWQCYANVITRCQFTAVGDVVVKMLGVPYANSTTQDFYPSDAWVRLYDETQVVPASEEPGFTSLAPAGNPAALEVQRMMQLMKHNAEQRERHLRDEMAALRAMIKTGPAVIE